MMHRRGEEDGKGAWGEMWGHGLQKNELFKKTWGQQLPARKNEVVKISHKKSYQLSNTAGRYTTENEPSSVHVLITD
jgi:uncharacterized protein YeaO (DUF488 family)